MANLLPAATRDRGGCKPPHQAPPAWTGSHSIQGDFIPDNGRDTVLPCHRNGYVYPKSEGDRTHAWGTLGNQVTATSAISQ